MTLLQARWGLPQVGSIVNSLKLPLLLPLLLRLPLLLLPPSPRLLDLVRLVCCALPCLLGTCNLVRYLVRTLCGTRQKT